MKAADDNDQPAPTGMLAWIGFGCCLFGLACLSVSFASPYWMQAWPNSFNEFRNLGLWQVCFQDYMHHKDDSQEIYDGCWWVFNTDKRYRKLREWLMPPWFISCQVMVVGTLLLQLGTVILVAMIFLHCCPMMNHEYLQTYWMFAASAMMFLVAMVSLITSIIFGIESQDRFWMPRPDLSFLSWGFGFMIITGIMAVISGVCFFYQAWIVYSELLRRENEFNKAALEMSGYPMSQSGFPASQSGYLPSYGHPSLGSEASIGYGKQSYATQPSFDGRQSYDGKMSYATQPSFDGRQSYSEKDYSYDQQYSKEPIPS